MYINKKMLSMLFIILLTFIAKPTLSEELKIGLVNLGVILKEIPMWRESQAKIKKQFDPRQRELKTMETELTSLNNKYLKNEKIMAKDEKESLIKQIQKSELKLRSEAESFGKDFEKVRASELDKIKVTVENAINAYAKENNFDLIIRSDGTTLYRKNHLDITQDIISELE
ncbi:MAG: OmpH family outer membrane protein [Pseudomonadota bacterium]|nr:OmpH family outer membrane protein [Pseudomonadota bacterium]MED5274912.1 OmpH family outer membrane protein [Pseudomonadota bacterium]|tara:strand:- start:9329 stop:9841 length:513 start_codon:yes stop_codon:yes gene_type:complete